MEATTSSNSAIGLFSFCYSDLLTAPGIVVLVVAETEFSRLLEFLVVAETEWPRLLGILVVAETELSRLLGLL